MEAVLEEYGFIVSLLSFATGTLLFVWIGGVNMKNGILAELNIWKNYETKTNKKQLRPYYLFVQKYGRTLVTDIQQIAEGFGKNRFFCFKRGNASDKGSLTECFRIELEKNAELGKEFNGLVLILLNGSEEEKERIELYQYITDRAAELSCVFMTQSEITGEVLKQEMEQYLPLVRMKTGESYDLEEQLEVFTNTLWENGAGLTSEASEYARQVLSDVEWNETDHVENRIRNIAYNLVYEQILEGKGLQRISVRELEQSMKPLQKEQCKKFRIGFAPREETKQKPFDKENEKAAKNEKEMVA